MPTRTFNEAFPEQSPIPESPRTKHKKSKSVSNIYSDRLTPPYEFGTPIGSLNGGLHGQDESSDALNVIIPIGGIGSRFQKEGYRFPKPLINIVGRPMICWLIEKLSLRPDDTLWIAINEAVDEEFQVGQSMKKWFPKLDARLLRLKYLTKGATETLFIISQSMSADHLKRRTVSLDCDTIYFADVLTSVRNLPTGHGACFFFEDTGSAPIFSYIRTDEKGLIHDIKEKRAISNKANSGAYVFPSGSALHSWSAKGLDEKLEAAASGVNVEYFTSLLIAEMIRSGEVPFVGVPISTEDFSCVGTPNQLKAFLRRLRNNDPKIHSKKQRFCFDLDMTLVGTPEVPGDYSTCPPIWRNIELVRQLHECGHHIIIQTARRMKTHKGNLGAVIADIGRVTFDSLAKFGIPYDDIFFGKPWADVYVDDLAVHANMDTRREIGWMAEEEDDSDVPSSPSSFTESKKQTKPKKPAKKGVIAPREFNHVQVVGDRFIKSSKSPAILGEIYFYSHIPNALASLFPSVHSIRFEEETATYSVTMERIKGVTFSHLLVGRALTKGRFNAFLSSLHKIHSASSASTHEIAVSENLQQQFASRAPPSSENDTEPNIYANYAAKLTSRYETYKADYDALSPSSPHTTTTHKIYHHLLTLLESYESHHSALPAPVIHGDPVFSNAILDDKQEKVYFFDVRAMQGDTFTMKGDVCYDLAKVWQSLQGYDHALLSNPEESDGMERAGNRIITPEPESLHMTASLSGLGGGGASLMSSRAGTPSLMTPHSHPHPTPHSQGRFIIDAADERLLSTLRTQFWEFVEEQYGGKVQRKDIEAITASLLFSLIPLHRAEMRGIFLEMCERVLRRCEGV